MKNKNRRVNNKLRLFLYKKNRTYVLKPNHLCIFVFFYLWIEQNESSLFIDIDIIDNDIDNDLISIQ
jgi:hypothetical protein